MKILATADVTILGAGVFGLSIAFCCAQRGARVRVIDPAGVAADDKYEYSQCKAKASIEALKHSSYSCFRMNSMAITSFSNKRQLI